MHARERAYHERDNNRIVRPFEWGLNFVIDHVNGDDPRELLRRHAEAVKQSSADFYELQPIDDFKLTGDFLTWTSTVRTPAAENDLVRARYFPAKPRNKARPPAERGDPLDVPGAGRLPLARLAVKVAGGPIGDDSRTDRRIVAQ